MRVRAWSLLTAVVLVATGCRGGAVGDAGGQIEAMAAPVSDGTVAMAPPTTLATTTTAPATTEVPTADPCVVTVVAGDSLSRIATTVGGVTVADLQDENWLAAGGVIHPGDQLDVCVGNDIDDVTGTSRLAPPPAAVRRQQEQLNALFAGYRIPELVVDGDSGPLTRQMLCAARMGLGLPVAATHMGEGSPEEEVLLAADSLSIPDGAPVWADRWILIDKTCQVMFTGEGDDGIVQVYPTSTGEPGYETRDTRTAAFRFDPAADNGGWHDSSNFPVAVDNPLNGNMYKPIYFNDGQAIHGANYVPPEPRSKGCARLWPLYQDELIDWLGLADLTEPTWSRSQIGVTVVVQGDYREID